MAKSVYDQFSKEKWAAHMSAGILPGSDKLPGGPIKASLPRITYLAPRISTCMRELLSGDADKPMTVVDLGGGTGEMLAFCLQQGSAVSGILVDNSATNLTAATALCSFAGPRFTAVEADLNMNVYLENECADFIMINHVHSELPITGAQALYQYANRFLKFGGRLFVEKLSDEIFTAAVEEQDRTSLPLAVSRGCDVDAITMRNPELAVLKEALPNLPAHATHAWIIYTPAGPKPLPHTIHSDTWHRRTAKNYGLRLMASRQCFVDAAHAHVNKALQPYFDGPPIVTQFEFIKD